MSSQLAIKRLTTEYKQLYKNPHENAIVRTDNKNIFICHFVLHGLKEDFSNGVYHGKIIFPTEYPNKAPSIKFSTPNGRFRTNVSICLSFTSYHQEHWSPTWSISNMITGLISFMYTNEVGVGYLSDSYYKRQDYALNSMGFNVKNQEFVEHFQENIESLKSQYQFDNDKILKGQEIIKKEDEQKKIKFFIVQFVMIVMWYFIAKYYEII